MGLRVYPLLPQAITFQVGNCWQNLNRYKSPDTTAQALEKMTTPHA